MRAEGAGDAPATGDRPMRVLIVGGVAGGMSAATRLRRLDERAEIVVFERGDYVSFANCGLPYYVGGVITDRDALLLQTPASLGARFRLDVRVGHEVVTVDRDAKVAHVRTVATGEMRDEPYDALILAGGADAVRSDRSTGLPVRTLRTIDDVDAITTLIDAAPAEARAVVIGGGYIGLEAVENLVRRGVHVTLVHRGGHVLSPLDPEMAAPVLDELRAHGVELRLSATVASLGAAGVALSDGTRIPADFVIEAAGIRPDTRLAEQAGVVLGPSGGIAADARQRTSDPSIFAVGDGVEKRDWVDAAPTLVALAGLANRHGRAAADAIGGVPTDAAPALGTSIVGVFDLTVAMTGWSERRLIAAGRAHRVLHTHPASHATYYPGATTMSMKLLVDPGSDLMLGAQIVGRDGVDKRIDVIATAMAGGLTASALSRLELAYAPQYGAAKDAVNQLGYVADNLATGATRSLQWHELEAARACGGLLVDVRSPREFAAGAIPGAVNIPLDVLRERHGELGSAPVIVHCQVGQRGHTAARILSQLGYDVRNLDGGYRTWSAGMAALAE